MIAEELTPASLLISERADGEFDLTFTTRWSRDERIVTITRAECDDLQSRLKAAGDDDLLVIHTFINWLSLAREIPVGTA